MGVLFYLVAVILLAGLAGSIIGFLEWARHGFNKKPIFFWASGLLLINWYELPALFGLSGQTVVLSDFNALFALTLPVAFLGFELIYLGSRFATGEPRSRTIVAIIVNFALASVFYGILYGTSLFPASSLIPSAGAIAFFGSVFLLNLIAGLRLFRRARLIVPGTRQIAGAIAYIIASLAGMVRVGMSVFFSLVHPPQFAILRFFAPEFIIAQATGLAFMILSFFLLHATLDDLRIKS